MQQKMCNLLIGQTDFNITGFSKIKFWKFYGFEFIEFPFIGIGNLNK